MLTSVLLAKHGCHPPGLGPVLAGLGSKEMATHLTEASSTVATSSSAGQQQQQQQAGGMNQTSSSAAGNRDCDLCGGGQDLGLRENVSNASQGTLHNDNGAKAFCSPGGIVVVVVLGIQPT